MWDSCLLNTQIFRTIKFRSSSCNFWQRNMVDEYKNYLNIALEAAKEAGAVIKDAYHKSKNVMNKGDVDLVTETDQQCEKIIANKLRNSFPDHLFIGEEGSAEQGYTETLTDAPTWMVDPVDGTTNFVHKYPFVCVSIGLFINGEGVVGVVYNPILDELFSASKGGGAFLNGEPIQVSQEEKIGKALVATELGVTRDQETVQAVYDRIQNITMQARSIRCCGSCAMNICGVACGRLDGFYEIGFGGPWDVAGGAVILKEAGGELRDPIGTPFQVMSRRVLATNTKLTQQIVDILKESKCGTQEPQPI
eukprot:TRINITY_DN36235_c0_g1_i1.p1 TRINITY_DN36235_c0_g1~~TRINITY_DN36235_c0_g1_i1.p1  ORF type:complete len:307 (-),score=47.15 TRINITY_DN36235_c0_g1_i1:271-1191(-)